MLVYLEAQYLTKDAGKWKTFVMFMNPKHENTDKLKQKLSDYSSKLGLRNVALTFISSPTDSETAGVYAINPKVKNTVFAYRKRVIIKKTVDFDTNSENFSTLINF